MPLPEAIPKGLNVNNHRCNLWEENKGWSWSR